MNKKFILWFSISALILCFNMVLLGQETTGSMEITVRDAQGAVVPSASVTITNSAGSTTSGFRRTVVTNASGFINIVQIQPGRYDIVVAPVSGFAERRLENIQVSLGQATPVNVELGATTTAVVDVDGSGSAIAIDPGSSSIQTTVSAQEAELIPKGLNFTSVLKVSPAVRGEPKAGGFQIDGASGAENTFVIDGQEVTNVRTGTLNGNSNLPFQLVQEVQIKSSGFGAEYGGATGGVINVVTKGGSNDFRGEFGTRFVLNRFAARAGATQILNSSSQNEYVPSGEDGGLTFQPSGTLGGRIIKDRLWFFVSATPQITTTDRTINYRNPTTRALVSTQNYSAKQTNEYYFTRLDAQPISRLRLTGSYTYNPIIQKGTIPTYGSFLGSVPNGVGLSGSEFYAQTGGRQNSQSVTGQVVYSVTNNLIVSARAGHYFLNQKLGTEGFGSISTPSVACSTAASAVGFAAQFPTGFGCVKGNNNGVVLYDQTLFDATKRNTVDADATLLFNLGGRHELKGGYQFNGIGNQLESRRAPQIVLYLRSVGATAGRTITPTPGAIGSGLMQRFGQFGDVSSSNNAIYIQDSYQPFRRLTLNLGVRAERENVPSFAEGLRGIEFGFADKIAPRLGAAYDITGSGKSKISAFYGWFYDRFKYELPRGSFGGNFFRRDYFEILPGDTLASFTPAAILGNFADPIGGACPSTGFIGSGRSRCQIDFRVPSNTGGDITAFGGIDPDLRPFRQSEMSVTFEQALMENYVFSARYVRKNVDSTVEDVGFLTPAGSESYIIGNPGLGLTKSLLNAAGIESPKAIREYNALELRLVRRFANSYYFDASYVYSRLYGNYSGLASSDEDGRTSPNVNRFFDLPNAAFTAGGKPALGRLATDRPHVFKFTGAYTLGWERFGFGSSNNSTSFQLYTTAQSGTPLTTFVDVFGITTVPLTGRGDLGRTPRYLQSDVAIRHSYSFGRDNKFKLIGDVDILNVFNQRAVTSRFQFISAENVDLTDPAFGLITATEAAAAAAQPTLALRNAANAELYRLSFVRNLNGGALAPITALANSTKDARFNLPSAFQEGRSVNFGFRLVF